MWLIRLPPPPTAGAMAAKRTKPAPQPKHTAHAKPKASPAPAKHRLTRKSPTHHHPPPTTRDTTPTNIMSLFVPRAHSRTSEAASSSTQAACTDAQLQCATPNHRPPLETTEEPPTMAMDSQEWAIAIGGCLDDAVGPDEDDSMLWMDTTVHPPNVQPPHDQCAATLPASSPIDDNQAQPHTPPPDMPLSQATTIPGHIADSHSAPDDASPQFSDILDQLSANPYFAAPGIIGHPLNPLTYVALIVESMNPDHRARLGSYLAESQLKVATACSGTDIPITQLRAFETYMSGRFDVTPNIVHTFSCENNTKKQTFIKTMSPDMGALFPDVCLLGGQSAVSVLSPDWPQALNPPHTHPIVILTLHMQNDTTEPHICCNYAPTGGNQTC